MAVAAGSSDVNPIEFYDDWTFIKIANTTSPGVIAIDGIRGFERETAWDKKKGKGVKGATLTLTQYPPAEGSIEFLLWEATHFKEWVEFRKLLKYSTDKASGNATAADAFDIYHPALADVGISQVVTHKISPIYHRGRGLYTITVDLIEWTPPPPVSVIGTTASSKPIDKNSSPGKQPDAVANAQAELAAAQAANAAQVWK